MSAKNGGPVFPICVELGDGSYKQLYGISLRDYFAAAIADEADAEYFASQIKEAALGRACPPWQADPLGCLQWNADWRAFWRGMRADAMLKERAK